MNFNKIKKLILISIFLILISSCVIRPSKEVIKYDKFSSPEHFASHYSQVFKNAFIGKSFTWFNNNLYRIYVSDPSFRHDKPLSPYSSFKREEKVVVLNKGVIFDEELEKLKSNKDYDVQNIGDFFLSAVPPKLSIYYYDRSIRERKHDFSIKDDKYKIITQLGDDGDTIKDISIQYLGKNNAQNN